jgi:ribosomal protein S30
METFSLYSKAGFVVPQTVRLPAQVTTHEGPPRVRPLQSREGGAFTIKKNMVSPIPEQLFTFYGDDWFFKCVRKNGGRAYRIANNTIFHYVGISRDLPKRDELGLPPLQCDRAAWEALNIR